MTKKLKSQIINHYGVYIDSNKPITGVQFINTIPDYIMDEIYHDSINLEYEAFLKTNPNDDDIDLWESQTSDTLLIGDWKQCKKTGLYSPLKSGNHGYSAIVNECTIQIVYSKKTMRADLCSPCYPGQADIDSPNKTGFKCYCLPV